MRKGSAGPGIPAGEGFGTTRIEALADGIFAVAMTLLVLDVKPPDGEVTPAIMRRIVARTALFATIPLLSMAAVFYNTRLALYLYFLLPIVHFLPGRVDMPESDNAAPADGTRAPK
jgi:hypothetical protein